MRWREKEEKMPDKTVAQKLQIKEGYTVLLTGAADDYKASLDVPSGVAVIEKSSGPVDVIQVFLTSWKDMESQLPALKKLLKPKGILWASYPKGTSKIKADINRDSIREYVHTLGLETVALIALDDTWSALRLKVV
jgi:hypothetical protein